MRPFHADEFLYVVFPVGEVAPAALDGHRLVIGRSAVVDEGTIVTAVAGSSKKVGGSRTQKSSRERPARSI